MQDLKLEVAGLYTHPNPLDPSSRPKGALAKAENIVIDRENLAESRRGFGQYSLPIANAEALYNFHDDLVLYANNVFKLDNGSGTFATINVAPSLSASFDGPAANVLPASIQANESLYLTTDQGVIKLDNAAGSILRSGAPRGLDLRADHGNTGVGFLANNTSVAYRVVWGYEDDNGYLILGSPSPRAEVSNLSGSPQNVTLDFSVPVGITSAWFYQVYRSDPSVAATVPGDDQLQLSFQKQYVSGTTISVVDTTTDARLGAALYTNTTQDGPLAFNEQPPYAVDVCTYLDMALYANTKYPQSVVLTFNALANSANVTIDGQVYTGAAAENVTTKSFYQAGTLEEMVQSLSRVVNRNASSNVKVTWLGGGSFFAERIDFGAAFVATSSNTALFNEALPATSSDDAAINGVSISKNGQVEAVPRLNSLRIGRADRAILRIVPTRDAVFVLKADGIFRITGTSPDTLAQEAHDTTYSILNGATACALENTVFCVSTKGVISISVSGVTPVSRAIEKDILQLTSLTNFKTLAWSCAYKSDRKYILGLPSSINQTKADLLYVFNAYTGAWTNWIGEWQFGLVKEADDKLYLIRSTDSRILQERKAFSILDYAEDEFAVTITNYDPNTYTVTLSNAALAVVGQTLKQNTATAVVTDVNVAANTITTESTQFVWANSAATLYDPIPVKLQWVETSGDNPGVVKMFPEATFFFEQARFREISLRVVSNFVPAAAYKVLRAKPGSAWGRFLWGAVPWSSRLGVKQAIRTFFSREVCRALWISIEIRLNQAFNKFGLSGASIIMLPTSTRFK
jgi:hypothetical protein